MGLRLDYDLDRVLAFVAKHEDGVLKREHMVGIGLVRADEIVAAVVFENITDHNAWAHVAAVPGRRWLDRAALKVPFIYAFDICKVDRLSGYIEDSNTDSKRFAEHLGFKVEARLHGAARNGGDVLIYVLWKKDCRYVDQK